MRDLTNPEGAFYSAEDADSPDPENPDHSGEGSFYIWRKAELDQALGAAATAVENYFGVEADGNVDNDPHNEFGGRNILYVAHPELAPPAAPLIEALFKRRSLRPRAHLDAKVLTAWNGQMISAFACGYLVLADEAYLQAAERPFHWIWSTLFVPATNQLWRRFCDGEAAIPAFLDDYAFLGQAALTLFEATGSLAYLDKSILLAHQIADRFEDPQGGFFSTEALASDLLLRMKDDYDGAEPSGNSLATDLFIRLGHLLGDDSFAVKGERALAALAGKSRAQPTMAPQMLCAAARLLATPEHFIVCVANETVARSAEVQALLRDKRKQFAPFLSAFALVDGATQSPFLASLMREKRLTVYHCQKLACQLPVAID